ncbi:hypothetical protein DEF23_22290 [Marinitenerispora sediminis]|uniref:Uncharacterized protein n=1 Tax=Marinitenerispora sediminis TaxID=1931232 RepID=A0A368T4G5_9ACTN|nr:hypothetical protein DEF28_18835 [Marinitenerispora sediminis]RCV50320.1 hypothetical protein DEF23_22290 [Marinitenerispora sediminis]RCV57717.1 hypothetical protein DEF24_14805 [Marinitenerispora sediminis]
MALAVHALVMLPLGGLLVLGATVGPLGGTSPGQAFLLSALGLAAGPVLLWLLVKPLCALGRWIGGRLGGHRVLWALLLSALAQTAVYGVFRAVTDPDAALGLTLLLSASLVPVSAVYAAVRPAGPVPRSRTGRWVLAGLLVLVGVEDLPDTTRSGGAPVAHLGPRPEDVFARLAVRESGRTVYRERAPKAWTLTVLGTYAAAMAAMWLTADSGDATGGALLLSVLFFVLFVLPLLVEPFLKFRYNRIRLTGHTLRVGRHTVPLAELVAGAAGTDGLARAVRDGTPVPMGGRPAWSSTPARWRPVLVPTRHGETLLVPARHPERLIRALHAADGPAGEAARG